MSRNSILTGIILLTEQKYEILDYVDTQYT